MMHVYRLETRAGRGPYRIPRPSATELGYPTKHPLPSSTASYLRIEQAWANGTYKGEDDPHPAPFEDGIGPVSPGAWSALETYEYCGFESEEAMRAWFFREPQDPAALDAMGLQVTIWEVDPDDIRKGNKQLVFVRSEANLVTRQSPLEYPV